MAESGSGWRRGYACWRCGSPLSDADLPITRHRSCASCYEPLHCCRMCRFFSDREHGNCLHDRAEPPLEKERNNFCDFFRPGLSVHDPAREDRNQGARQRLGALFGEEADSGADAGEEAEPPGDPLASSRARLDNLFDS